MLQDCDSPMELRTQIIPEFKIYNRYHELEKREREKKELAWEKELLLAMDASDPLDQNKEKQGDANKARRQNGSQSCPRLNVNTSNINTRLENSPRLKKLRSCESTTFHSKSAVLKQFCSIENYECSSKISENEFLSEQQHKAQTKIMVDQCDAKPEISGEDRSTLCTNCHSQKQKLQKKQTSGNIFRGLELKEYTLCGICLRNGGREVACDISNSLHGLEYIDRTPSPTEHKQNG